MALTGSLLYSGSQNFSKVYRNLTLSFASLAVSVIRRSCSCQVYECNTCTHTTHHTHAHSHIHTCTPTTIRKMYDHAIKNIYTISVYYFPKSNSNFIWISLILFELNRLKTSQNTPKVQDKVFPITVCKFHSPWRAWI